MNLRLFDFKHHPSVKFQMNATGDAKNGLYMYVVDFMKSMDIMLKTIPGVEWVG